MGVAALVGNGLSIAIQPKFKCDSLTSSLRDKFESAGLDGAATALQKFAEQLGQDLSVDNGFEALLGPLDSANGVLVALHELAFALRAGMPAQSGRVLNALQRAEKFSDAFYRFGSTGILQIIEEISAGVDNSIATSFVDELYKTAGSGQLTIATLNYDALLLSAVLGLADRKRKEGDRYFLADLADGRFPAYRQVTPSSFMQGRRLRRSSLDLPSWPVTLLALHGSLTWLRDTRSGDVWKFPLEDIRKNASFWHEMAASKEWRPSVVMTNQSLKASRITEHPFKLACRLRGP